jgi:regulatory protein
MATRSSSQPSRGRSQRAGLSLKGRGLALLAQRDHSRVELKRKLMPHARAMVLAEMAAAAELEPQTHAAKPVTSIDANDAAATPSAADRVNEVLDWLQARDYLSDARFAESRTHARSAKFGNMRIRHELSQHGVTLTPESAQRLRDSEFERAKALQARKFGRPPANANEHAKQSRFLAGRGFSSDAIRQVMRLVGWAPAAGELDEAEEE